MRDTEGSSLTTELLLKRAAPVVWNGTGPLTSEEIQGFEEKGFLLLREVLAHRTIDQLKNKCEQLKEKPLESKILERDQKTVRSLFNLQNLLGPEFVQVLTTSVQDIAEQILSRGLYIHQCHVNFKQAFSGGEYFWHSDYTFWYWEDGMAQPRALSIVFFLDEHWAGNGPLMVLPGSQNWYYQQEWTRNSDEVREQVRHDYQADYKDNGLAPPEAVRELSTQEPPVTVTGRPGDVLIMDANLWHASGANLSPMDRKAIFLILNHQENKLGEPFSGQPPRPSYISSRNVQFI